MEVKLGRGAFLGIIVRCGTPCPAGFEMLNIPNPLNPSRIICMCRLGPGFRKRDVPPGVPTRQFYGKPVKLRRLKNLPPGEFIREIPGG